MDAYDRAEAARAAARAAMVHELDTLARAHGARAAMMRHGICVWFAAGKRSVRWTWPFIGTASVSYEHESPADAADALRRLADVLADIGFEPALHLALGRAGKEYAAALERAQANCRIEKNRYHGD